MGKDTQQRLIIAVKCAIALDMPYQEGRRILQSYGYDSAELPASEFVNKLLQAAIINL